MKATACLGESCRAVVGSSLVLILNPVCVAVLRFLA